MTELRKGQRVWVEAEVIRSDPDHLGFFRTQLADGIVTDEDGDEVDIKPEDARADMPSPAHPTYLARREAMVRAMVAGGEVTRNRMSALIDEADEALRAIDETPVPEWAGGGAA